MNVEYEISTDGNDGNEGISKEVIQIMKVNNSGNMTIDIEFLNDDEDIVSVATLEREKALMFFENILFRLKQGAEK